MSISGTSVVAFERLLVSGQLKRDRDKIKAVLEIIGPADNKRISWSYEQMIKRTMQPRFWKKSFVEKYAINAVTGRVNTLKKFREIEALGDYYRSDDTGPVIVVRCWGDEREPARFGYRPYVPTGEQIPMYAGI